MIVSTATGSNNVPVFPINEESQIYRNVLEKYEEKDGEFISKTDGLKTGMTPATVLEMIHKGVESKKIPKFEEIPRYTHEEAKLIVSKYKEGRFLLGRSKIAESHLIVTYKKNERVEQIILPPGNKENTFVYPYFLFRSELSIEDVIKKFDGIEFYVRDNVRFWKNDAGEPTYIVRKLGEGGYSKVYQFIDTKNGMIGVFKDARRNWNIPLYRTKCAVQNEYDILSKIHAGKKVWGIQEKPYLCRDISITTKHYQPKERYGYIGLQYDGDYLDELFKSGLTLEDRLIDFHQLLYGLKILVEFGYLHGDLKLENIFSKRRKVIRLLYISDLGTAIHIEKESIDLVNLVAGGGNRSATKKSNTRQDFEKSMELAKTGNRIALIENEKKRDVFAMGCILFISISGHWPFKEGGWAKKYVGFVAEDNMAIKGVPLELKKFIERMLAINANDRFTAAEAFEKFEIFLKSHYPHVLEKIQQIMLQEGY